MYNGFYYHYKRDSRLPPEEGAYEVVGTGFNTETSNIHSENPKDFEPTEVVVYRPLFIDSLVYTAGKRFWIRPLSMFLQTVLHEGVMVPRFQKITEPAIVTLLIKRSQELYGEN